MDTKMYPLGHENWWTRAILVTLTITIHASCTSCIDGMNVSTTAGVHINGSGHQEVFRINEKEGNGMDIKKSWNVTRNGHSITSIDKEMLLQQQNWSQWTLAHGQEQQEEQQKRGHQQIKRVVEQLKRKKDGHEKVSQEKGDWTGQGIDGQRAVATRKTKGKSVHGQDVALTMDPVTAAATSSPGHLKGGQSSGTEIVSLPNFGEKKEKNKRKDFVGKQMEKLSTFNENEWTSGHDVDITNDLQVQTNDVHHLDVPNHGKSSIISIISRNKRNVNDDEERIFRDSFVSNKKNVSKMAGNGNGHGKHSLTKIIVASIFIPIGLIMCVAGLIGVCIDKCGECQERRKRNKRRKMLIKSEKKNNFDTYQKIQEVQKGHQDKDLEGIYPKVKPIQ